MNAVEKNGQPSMEEILASIRRIIAEEPNGPSPVIDLKAKPKPVLITSLIDEQPDFELPAIFRPNAQPTERHTPLFGRLTDAIRNASGVANDVRTAKPFDIQAADEVEVVQHSKSNGHNHRNGGDTNGGASEPALSQLNLARDEAMAAQAFASAHAETPAGHVNGHARPHVAEPLNPAIAEAPSITGVVSEWWNGSAAPAAKVAAPVDDVKREMVPFRDMRMCKMGALATPAPYTVPPSASEPAAPEVPSAPPLANTVYVHMDVPEVFQSEAVPPIDPSRLAVVPAVPPFHEPAPHLAHFGEVASFDGPAERYSEPPALPPQPLHPVAAANTGVEDATADLLRPMLRQWLAENMPRMVEKALHIELAESVKTGKKPGAL